MHFGIGSYTYTWAMGVPGYGAAVMTVDDLLGRAAAMGCDVVQLCDNVPLTEVSEQAVSAWRQRTETLDLRLQIGTRGVEPEHLLRFLRIAGNAGADLVRCMLPKTGRGADIAHASSMLAEVLPLYEREHVLLSLENHDRHRAVELRRLVDGLASPNFGICLDTVNSFGAAEDPVRVMETLMPVANCLHIKDFTISRVKHQMGFAVTGAPAGKGMLDIEQALSCFARSCPDGAVILELWTPFTGDPAATIAVEAEWADESARYLHRLLWEYGS